MVSKVMDILARPETKDNVGMLSDVFAEGLAEIQAKHADFLTEVRQCGVIMGLHTAHPRGGMALMAALVQSGVWAVFADYDRSTLQFKPGLLMPRETAQKVLQILDAALGPAQALAESGRLDGVM